MRAALPALALLALCACRQGSSTPSAELAWARLPAVAGRPGAAYVTLHGGAKDSALVGAWSALVARIELHEGGMAGGMATMRPLAALPVPAHGEVTLAPGGAHAMLLGVDPAIRPGTAIPLRLDFADGSHFEVEAKTVGPGGSAPY